MIATTHKTPPSTPPHLPSNSPHIEMLQHGEFLDGLGDLGNASIANLVVTAAPCSGQEASTQLTCHSTSPNTSPVQLAKTATVKNHH